MSLFVLLALALAPAPGWVELDRGSFHALTATPAEVVVPAWAASRALTLTPVEGGVLVRGRWTLRSLTRDAWFSGHVLGDMPGLRVEQVLWDGRPAATSVGPGGVSVAGRVSGAATIEVVAFVPGDPSQAALRLQLMPASRGTVEAPAPDGLVAALQAAGDGEAAPLRIAAPVMAVHRRGRAAVAPTGSPGPARFLTAAGAIDLSFGAAPAAPGDAAAVVVARAGLGLTVGDAELRGRGRLVWELRRGAVRAVEFTALGVGADLEVTGPGVRAVQRSGERVRVELQAPVSDRLELELRWSAALGKAAEARVDLPEIRFEGVFRAEASLQLARDGEVEAVPELQGWTPSSAAALPVWGQGLVEGAPTAAFTASAAASGRLDLLRFVPIAGPPVVVDVAAYTIATSREGRALMRAHYEVRNERAASLQIRPPPGYSILGVRVAGQTAMIARERDGAWRVPLQRSVDTVSGLLSFPVEVALIGEAVPWARRERRALPLPRLDAPVAVTRATLHLPPGYRSRSKPGDGEVVRSFTRGEGIHYGLGVGEVGAAEADALFQSAVKGWLDNDFARAQAELDRLRAMGAKNENIARLQGNLDLIAGKGKDEGASRRIREQARARAVADQVAQSNLEQQAQQSRQSGDYAAAESQYRAALEVGDRLARLEQRESVEQSSRNEDLRRELESTTKQAKSVEDIQVVGKKRGRVFKRMPAKYSSGPTSRADDDAGQDVSTGVEAAKPEVTRDEPSPVVATDKPTAAPVDGEPNRPTAAPNQPTAAPADVEPNQPTATPNQPTAAPNQPTAAAPADGEPSQPTATPVDAGVPVGGVSRDYTAIVEVAPTASRDAASISLAGASSVESFAMSPGVSTGDGLIARARRSIASRRAARAGRSNQAPADAKRRLSESSDTLDTRLPAPVVTASALSVVVPAVGEAVLYERLLLPAGAEHALEVSAREPLFSRD